MSINEKISKFCRKIDVASVIAYMFAIAIVGTVVIYFPEGFIGFVIGGTLGLNRDKIENIAFGDDDVD